MPRPPRNFFAGAIHHVYVRGNNQMPVLRDPQDHRFYRRLLLKAKDGFQLLFTRYTSMTNHVHFVVIQREDTGLAEAMQWVQSCYARYYNRRYHHSGHVWQGRYGARLIRNNADLLNVGRYVELNPVQAGMVDTPDEYPWSSYHFYAKGHRNDLISMDPAYEGLAETPAARQAVWRAFMQLLPLERDKNRNKA
jgi:putative transposase